MDLMHFFSILMNLSMLVFVVTSMLAMGLSLTVAQIVAPLRNPRLVLAALAANFILVLGLVDLSVLLFTANLLGRRTYEPQPAG